jgi:hypothetical protein
MNEIDYSDAIYPVRKNIEEAHNRFWKRLATAGSWLTAAERVGVAKEVRQAQTCNLCERRKAALSPYQLEGRHESASELPDVMIEVVHRVITDSGRLTKSWFDGIMQQGLSAEQYIEIIGTLVHLFSIDEFCRGIGKALPELPDPLPGEPSHYRPANIIEHGDGAWVPMLSSVMQPGPESDLWKDTLEGNVIRALSLVPDEVRSLKDLLIVHYLDDEEFMDLEKSPQGTLSRIQTEVVAARVSAYNDCFY